MNLLSDILTYIRRIIKSPSNSVITDGLLVDYVNRFWIMDVDARIQLFDLKKKYAFMTSPGVDKYNMPLYENQLETDLQNISFYPVYQGFQSPIYINGIQVPLQTQKSQFFNIFPNVTQNLPAVAVGNGGTNYDIKFPIGPSNSTPLNTPVNAILRGHVDIAGIIATGVNQDPIITNNLNPNVPFSSIEPAVYLTAFDSTGATMVISDSGQFLTGNVNYGLLLDQVPNTGVSLYPNGYTNLAGGYSTTLNTVNYFAGTCNVTFPRAVPAGVNINAQVLFFQTGLPRSALFYNNVLTLRSPPDSQYLVEIEAYLTPAAFFDSSESIPYAYMCEYIARGAARKILSDTGDIEQFQFYEPLFREQELLVWKRSQRQWTSTRTQTIYSQGINQGQQGFNNIGGSTF